MKNFILLLFASLSTIAMTAQNSWVQLSTGGEFTVGLGSDGGIYTWGYNGSGQLGNGDFGNDNVGEPTMVSGDNTYRNVAAGNFHAVAVGTDSTLWAWGYNGYGQANPVSSDEIIPRLTQIDTSHKWLKVYAGFNISFAVDTLNQLYVWGSNAKGEAGIGSNNLMIREITKVPGSENFKQLDCGKYFTLALDYKGNVWGWGDNSESVLTKFNEAIERLPVVIDSSRIYSKVASSYNSAHALTIDGDIYSWGSNEYLQSGVLEAPEILDTLMKVGENSAIPYRFTDITCGGIQCFAAEGSFGTLYSWGTNNVWRFVNGEYKSDTVIIADSKADAYDMPIASKGLDDGVNIFGGHILFFGKGSDRTTYCGVGPNHVGQIGTGEDRSKLTAITCGFGVITSMRNLYDMLIAVKVYPNPASDYLIVDGSENVINELRIVNMQGQTVYQEYCSQSHIRLDLTNLNSGIYYVQSYFKDGKRAYSKIIIQ